MSIEPSKTGIDYASIADAYGYKPIPEGFSRAEPSDVTIDWKAGAEQRQASQREAMKQFDAVPEGLLHTATIPTDKGNLSLDIIRKPVNRNKTMLHLCLRSSERPGVLIALFTSEKHGNTWDMFDRITIETYRGKGVASQMIEATENCVQAVANETGQDQEIVMEAAQLPVLSVFLRKGYEVVDEDKQRFAEVMSKLEAGDRQYVLASRVADFKKTERQARKTWYVFKRETYEQLGDKIWAYDAVDGEANYIKYSVRFKLRKKIEAKSNDIAGEVARVRGRVSSLEE